MKGDSPICEAGLKKGREILDDGRYIDGIERKAPGTEEIRE